jgi:hypothetical protein
MFILSMMQSVAVMIDLSCGSTDGHTKTEDDNGP